MDLDILKQLTKGGGKGGDSNSNFLQSMFNANSPVQSLRMMTQIGSKDLISGHIDKVNMLADGGELIQAALVCSQNDILKYYIQKGAKVEHPPSTVSKMMNDPHGAIENYRKSPFIIQAACYSNVECLKTLLSNGCKLEDIGYIGLSKRKKNQVISNAIGGAAYHGNTQVLKYLLSLNNQCKINLPAQERPDKAQKGNFVKECFSFTPLMLAACSDSNIECVKILLQSNADISRTDSQGNNLLHVAAYYGSTDTLEYLIKNVTLNVFERNDKGETPQSIAQEKKNTRAVSMMEDLSFKDLTKDKSEDLLNELEREEEKKEQQKQKKKEKKRRQKIKSLAEKEGVSFDEMEKKLKQEKEEKKRLEEEQRAQEEERQRLENEQENRDKQEKLKVLRDQQEAQRQHVERRVERARAIQNEQPPQNQQEIYYTPDTQFVHLKAKKPVYTEKPKVDQQEAAPMAEPVAKVEAKQKSIQQEMNRKQRKHLERQREHEYRQGKRGQLQERQLKEPKKEEEVDKEEVVDSGEESDSEEDSDPSRLTQEIKQNEVLGLGNEFKLQILASKKARRRLRKKIKQQHDEEELNKEKLRKVAEDKQAQIRREEQEEEQRLFLEEEEKKKKYRYFKEEPKPLYRVKTKEEKEELQMQEEAQHQLKAENKKRDRKTKQVVYRPKAKPGAETKENVKPNHIAEEDIELPQTVEPSPLHQIQESSLKPPVDTQYTNKHDSGYQTDTEKGTTQETKPKNGEAETVGTSGVQQEEEKEGRVSPPNTPNYKVLPNKSPVPLTVPLIPAPTTQGELTHQHVQQMQVMILTKEQEVKNLNQQLHKLQDEVAQLKQSHAAQAQPVKQKDDKELKSSINHLNEQLLREKALNKVIHTQLLDTEKQFKEEQVKRKEAEEKLFDTVYHSQNNAISGASASGEQDLLRLANEELIRKGKTVKELRQRVEKYEGKSIDNKSVSDLQTMQKFLSESLKRVSDTLELER